MNFFRPLQNASFALLGTLLGIPLQALGVFMVARGLGTAQFGVYGFALEFSYILSCLSDGGLAILASRELAVETEGRAARLSSLLVLKLIYTVPLYLLMLGSAWLGGMDRSLLLVVALVGAGNFCSSSCVMIVGMLRAYDGMRYEGGMTLLQGLTFCAQVLMLFMLIEGEARPVYVAICFLFSYIAALLFGARGLARCGARLHLQWDGRMIRHYAREGAPLAVAAFFLLTYSRFNILFLQRYGTPHEMGLYNAAFRLSSNLAVIPYVLAGAWLPVLSREMESSEEFRSNTRYFLKILVLAGAFIGIPLVLLAEQVLGLLYGKDFRAASFAFQLLVCAIIPTFISFWAKTVLESSFRQRAWVIAVAAGLAVNLLLCRLFVPAAGALGACWAMVGANLVIMVGACFSARKHLDPTAIIKSVTKVALAGVAEAGVIELLSPISWVGAALAGALVFMVLLAALREISIGELTTFFRPAR